ncbi:clathrin associated protein complex large subunit [Coemansia aciculifera]|uniref:AP-1 complex subunit gamma n=2 Tax=Coemansia aciculifera TaxID=417176 RepID=A0A9W8M464_9FUNG|nr:clathrin associated protein complex large subunit [Coemansia aciculifera]KAJ2870259.1 clathrin associated protein complex large subunit [Coemansia aciculifera]KAJ2879456.1 clathrin associated protein complex large subunit [Coemansia aciculifera]
MSFFRLKDLIRAVRVCKTAADERGVIQRESAAIRTSFKEVDSQDARYVNIQKLLYIYLLGYPVQFGQLECLKLVASPKFADKRVGYLGVTLLLDEKQDILTLLTNSLKTDMHSTDDYIVGLALGTLSNVASSEVAYDLVDEVERLLDSPRSYLRKKATLAGVRIIRREPELFTPFLHRAKSLLGDKHHGVQMGAVALLAEMCNHTQEALDEGRRLVPVIVNQLRALLGSGSSPEHDVGGISNPFLQVAILRLLRVVARGSQHAADELNDVLTLVATQTDSSKNVGTAILYECAVTALAIPSEQALRVMAINMLGKFLGNRDNNVRYVALATLSAAVITEAPSVQRHRATVIQCLRDNDISIRRRALDLSFALINESNVKPIVTEILRVLPHADLEFKPSMVYRLSAAITLFGDSLEWRIDNMLRVLSLGGKYVNARDMFKFIRLIALEADENLQRRAARISFALLERDVSQEKMVVAGTWLVGEYADLLVARSNNAAAVAASPTSPVGGLDDDDLDILGALGKPLAKKGDSPDSSGSAPVLAALDPSEELPQAIPEPADIVRLLSAIAGSSVVSNSSRHIALTALAKLSGRFADSSATLASIRTALGKHTQSMDVETQSRAVEFGKLLSQELDAVRTGVVDRMPAPEYTDVPYEEYVLNPTAMRMKALTIIKRPAMQPVDFVEGESAKEAAVRAAAEASKQSVVSDLLNLMDEAPAAVTASQPATAAKPVDALADLLGSATLSSTSPPTKTAAVHHVASPTESSGGFATEGLDSEYDIYNSHGLRITLTPSKKPTLPTVVDLLATFYNEGEMAVSGLNFLVAVPKSQKLQIQPPSGQHISVGATVTQLVRVSNPTKTAIRLRIKLGYTVDGQAQENMFEYNGFPASVV